MRRVFISILLSFVLFLGLSDVYAAVVPKYYNIVSNTGDAIDDAITLSSTKTDTFSAGTYYFYRNFVSPGPEEEQYTNVVSLCTDKKDFIFKKSVEVDPYILSLEAVHTDKSCTFPGTVNTGHRVDFIINSLRTSTDGTYDHPQMTLKLSSSTKFSLITSSYQTYTSYLIEKQNKQDLTCRDSNNLFPGWIVGEGISASTGAIIDSDKHALSSNYIPVDFNKNDYYLSGLSSNLRTFVAAYNSNYDFLGRTGANKVSSYSLNSMSFSNASQGSGEIKYIRITSYYTDETNVNINLVNDLETMLNIGSSALSYEEYGKEICENKQDITNEKLEDLNNSITSEESPNLDGLSNMAGWLPSGPVDSILNLPLTFFNNLTTNLGKSCTPINLPLPYVNQDLTLPCINTIYENLGITTFINFLGAIVGALILYSYLLKLYQWVDNTLSFNENTDSVDNWGGV